MCTCMYGWEQLHRVWPRARHLPPSAVAHKEGPGLGAPCIVFGEPSDHAGWIALTHRLDVLTGSPPLNGRRAETKTRDKSNTFLLYEYSMYLNCSSCTVFPRWVQSSSSSSSRTVRAHSSLQALCSTLPIITHLRTNLRVPSSWNTQ